jgi:hypothetical protein
LGIAERFERHGATALVGETIGSSRDLAEIGQIYCDPRHETLRVFFTNGDKIVLASRYFLRLTDNVRLPFAKQALTTSRDETSLPSQHIRKNIGRPSAVWITLKTDRVTSPTHRDEIITMLPHTRIAPKGKFGGNDHCIANVQALLTVGSSSVPWFVTRQFLDARNRFGICFTHHYLLKNVPTRQR